MEDRYVNKENYVTRNPDPIDWLEHSNSKILVRYQNIIKGTVLDFGCNHGACSFLILKNPLVTSVVGLDLNSEAIEIAKKTKEQKYKNNDIEFICSNIFNFEYEKVFDTIITFHTLEHIYPEDTYPVLQILKNNLNVGGYVIVSIPYEKSYDGPEHVSYYNEESLSKIFVENGYECVECFYDNECGLGGILTGVFKKNN